MDRQIRRLGYALVTLFVLLFVQVNYLQVFAADDLRNNPANAKRLLILEYDVDRGSILASDGRTVLAKSVPTRGEFKYLRRYPNGPLYADVTGFYSLVYGRYQLEQSYNDDLSGASTELLPSALVDQILGRPKRGASVVTTIVPGIQQAAADALGDFAGAVVAMDPATGKILALVANPTYDPNDLSSHEPKAIRAAWRRLNADPSKPLLSNADQQLYAPGSTYKLVTATAALENGYGPNQTWPNPHELDLPLTNNTLSNFGGSTCPGGSRITMALALEVSCNVVFGRIGLELGARAMAEQARAFGFGEDVSFSVPFQEGKFPEATSFKQNEPLLAYSAIGQADVLANPLQMALVGSAIANGGVEMQPQLVEEVRDPDGRVVRSFRPKVYGRPMSESSARDMTRMMVDVVSGPLGTGAEAQIPGIQVAGKTGTAQPGESGATPYAWFVSFAPAENPQVAVAVLVLDGGTFGTEATGGHVAAPIAKQVMEAALGVGG